MPLSEDMLAAGEGLDNGVLFKVTDVSVGCLSIVSSKNLICQKNLKPGSLGTCEAEPLGMYVVTLFLAFKYRSLKYFHLAFSSSIGIPICLSISAHIFFF